VSVTTSKTIDHVVVVVEDEPVTRLVACATLTDAGFHVLETDHVDHALALLRTRAPEIHALFTDVHVPGTMDGLALAHHSKRNWPWIVLLIASGRAKLVPDDLPEGGRFLQKPYDPDLVVTHLHELLSS
jgi:CheY-like chemotaxis protein